MGTDTVIYNGTGTSTSDATSIVNGTTYYYAAFAHDQGPNYATPAVAVNAMPQVPAPATPTGATTGTVAQTTAEVSWNAATGATSYTVSYGLTSAANDSTVTVSGTSTTITGLTANSTYYWKVLSVNAGGPSSYSSAVSFATLTNAPIITQFELTSATGIPTTEAKATNVISIIGNNFGSSQESSTITFANNKAVTNVYYWSNAKIDLQIPNGAVTGNVTVSVNGLTSTETITINPPAQATGFTATPGNAKVDLAWINPVDGSFTGLLIVRNAGSAPTFTPVKGTAYTVGQTVGTDTVIYNGTGTSTSDATSIVNGTTYYYAAFAHDQAPNYTATSITAEATPTLPIPSVPTGLLTTNITTNSATVSWEAVTGATSYLFSIGLDSNANLATLEGTTTTLNTSSLIPSTTYYWKVLARNSSGDSAFAAAVNFTTTTPNKATMSLDKSSVSRTVIQGQNATAETITLGNTGNATLNYTVADDKIWLSVSPASGTVAQGANTTLTINFNTSAESVGTDTATITISDGNASNSPQTITVNLTVTAAPVTATTPEIISILPDPAEIGQTIVITGKNFGATKESTSAVRFSLSTLGNPTAWSDTSITVAVPSGIPSGETNVAVIVGTLEALDKITVTGQKIYLDDFEGGSVGSYSSILSTSGYYTAGNGITPTSANINSQGPTSIAAKTGARGMRINYSYTSNWGAGWGATLANELNLSKATGISVNILWDGSSNEAVLRIIESDLDVTDTTISNSTLTSLGSTYGEVKKNITDFSLNPADSNGDGIFDWSKVTGYMIQYKTKDTTINYQYFDDLVATIAGTGGSTASGEVVVDTISPASGPAGTKFTISGHGFGDSQGQSLVLLENSTTKVAYQVNEILSWSSTAIELIVPRLAGKGNYSVKVIKVGISTGSFIAQESNTLGYEVTASAAASGNTTIYPNPFNPLAAGSSVTIAFNPGSSTNIGIYIYDMTARLAKKLVVSGSSATWDGIDDYSTLVGDGAYIVRVVNEETKTLIAKGKLLIIKK